MLGKYEAARMRNSIAEGVATGGAGMGLYMRVDHPAAYETASTYTKFLHQYPIPAEDIDVALAVGDGGGTARIKSVDLHSPDGGKSVQLEYKEKDQRLTFRIPKIQVYSVVEIQLARPLE